MPPHSAFSEVPFLTLAVQNIGKMKSMDADCLASIWASESARFFSFLPFLRMVLRMISGPMLTISIGKPSIYKMQDIHRTREEVGELCVAIMVGSRVWTRSKVE